MWALCIGLALALDLGGGSDRRHHRHHHRHHHAAPKAALAATASASSHAAATASASSGLKEPILRLHKANRTHAAVHHPHNATAKAASSTPTAAPLEHKAAPEQKAAVQGKAEAKAAPKAAPKLRRHSLAHAADEPKNTPVAKAKRAAAKAAEAAEPKSTPAAKAKHVAAKVAEPIEPKNTPVAKAKRAAAKAAEAAEPKNTPVAKAKHVAAKAAEPIEPKNTPVAKAKRAAAKVAEAEAAVAKAAAPAEPPALRAAHEAGAPKLVPAHSAQPAASQEVPKQAPRLLRGSESRASAPLDHLEHVLDDDDTIDAAGDLDDPTTLAAGLTLGSDDAEASGATKLAKGNEATLVTGSSDAVKPLPDLQTAGLGLDFDKEDRAYQRVAGVLEKFPRLASKPIWDLVNPSALASHNPPVVDMKMRDMQTLLSPSGKELAKSFPELTLRDLPLFEWMPKHVAPKDWANPAEVTLSQYVPFLPDLVARTALQDVRLQDLQAVAERKRLIWADTWKAVHANGTVDLAASVKELSYKLQQAETHRQEAMVDLRALQKEHKRAVVERKELQKRYEEDQELIMHQQRMLADGQKVQTGLELKLSSLEATRREQRRQLEEISEKTLNFSHEVNQLRRNIHEKTQEIWKLGQEKEQLLTRIQMLQNRLLEDAQLATQLKAAKREDHVLKQELNATLVDEAAEERRNKALTTEVETLEAENHRLAAANLGDARWGEGQADSE